MFSPRLQLNLVLLLVVASFSVFFMLLQLSTSLANSFKKYSEIEKLPKIYAITPTFARPVQKAELTRISNVLLLAPNVHWVIVEDANHTSTLVRNLLQRTGLDTRSVLLHATTPSDYKLSSTDLHGSKPRGVAQRNAALEWVLAQLAADPHHAIVYFMDDDNAYSPELFREMSRIERGRVGVWPVGLTGGMLVQTPLVNASGFVSGYNSIWAPERPFPIDMAAFAISAELFLRNPNARFRYDLKVGYQESEILKQLVETREQLQPLANRCWEVLVWHTRTQDPNLSQETQLERQGRRSDEGFEV